MQAIKRTLDYVGDVIPYTARNGVRINLQWLRLGAYRVEVLTSGPIGMPIEDLTGSYETERDARAAARFLAVINNAGAVTG